jgi:hypothetical protein
LNYNGKEFGKIITSNPKKEEAIIICPVKRNWQKFSNPSIIARTIACIFIYTFFGFFNMA